MRSGFSSYRARFAASVTALVGLGAVSGCAPRTVSDADRSSQSIASPQPVVNQQPQNVYVTTEAVGEEEGAYQTPSTNVVTTLAIGEEDGTGPIPVEPNGGIGSGAGPIPIDPSPSQIIGGGEQGDFERVFIPPAPGAGQATTFAIGEEG